MATVQVVKLWLAILLVAAGVASTSAGWCLYVVDVRTSGISFKRDLKVRFTVHDSAPADPDASAVWTLTKTPAVNSPIIGPDLCPSYQFVVFDWQTDSCKDPCRLTLSVDDSESSETDFWVPGSIRIRDSDASGADSVFDRTFTIIPPQTVSNGAAALVLNQCGQ